MRKKVNQITVTDKNTNFIFLICKTHCNNWSKTNALVDKIIQFVPRLASIKIRKTGQIIFRCSREGYCEYNFNNRFNVLKLLLILLMRYLQRHLKSDFQIYCILKYNLFSHAHVTFTPHLPSITIASLAHISVRQHNYSVHGNIPNWLILLCTRPHCELPLPEIRFSLPANINTTRI